MNPEISYETSWKYRNAVTDSGVHSSIKASIKELDEFAAIYDEMLLLIPKFGDEYDALGINTRVNIEEFSKETALVSKDLKSMNGESVTASAYYAEAKAKDDIITGNNRSAAIKAYNAQQRQQQTNS